jgi:hypothetical protein
VAAPVETPPRKDVFEAAQDGDQQQLALCLANGANVNAQNSYARRRPTCAHVPVTMPSHATARTSPVLVPWGGHSQTHSTPTSHPHHKHTTHTPHTHHTHTTHTPHPHHTHSTPTPTPHHSTPTPVQMPCAATRFASHGLHADVHVLCYVMLCYAQGFTPLMFAALSGKKGTALQLLEAGARTDIESDGGRTAVRFVRPPQHLEEGRRPIPSHFIPTHPNPSHPIPSYPIPSHRIASHRIASHPIPSYPIPYIHIWQVRIARSRQHLEVVELIERWHDVAELRAKMCVLLHRVRP